MLQSSPTEKASLVMRVLLSLFMLGLGTYLLIHPVDPDSRKWAYGMIGLVIGYWLK